MNAETRRGPEAVNAANNIPDLESLAKTFGLTKENLAKYLGQSLEWVGQNETVISSTAKSINSARESLPGKVGIASFNLLPASLQRKLIRAVKEGVFGNIKGAIIDFIPQLNLNSINIFATACAYAVLSGLLTPKLNVKEYKEIEAKIDSIKKEQSLTQEMEDNLRARLEHEAKERVCNMVAIPGSGFGKLASEKTTKALSYIGAPEVALALNFASAAGNGRDAFLKGTRLKLAALEEQRRVEIALKVKSEEVNDEDAEVSDAAEDFHEKELYTALMPGVPEETVNNNNHFNIDEEAPRKRA